MHEREITIGDSGIELSIRVAQFPAHSAMIPLLNSAFPSIFRTENNFFIAPQLKIM